MHNVKQKLFQDSATGTFKCKDKFKVVGYINRKTDGPAKHLEFKIKIQQDERILEK